MKFLYALLFVVGSVAIVFAAHDDDDHSNHCHINGYPSIHVNIGDHIDLPGACLRLLCTTTDLFKAVNTCETVEDSPQNIDFAKQLLNGKTCPK